MPNPQPNLAPGETATALIQPSEQGKGKLLWETADRPGARKVKAHALDILLELKLTDFDLAAELVKAAKAGEGWAVRYIYDRLAGMPVQRHEAKLLAQVDDTAQRLAKAYGLSVDEVRDRARQIAQGT